MALTASFAVDFAVFAQQYGTATTAAAERGATVARLLKQTVSVLTRSSSHPQLEVAAGETVQVNLGSMGSPKFILVESDLVINLRTSAVDGEAWALTPLGTGLPAIALLTVPVAGVWLHNAGAAAATVSVHALGTE